jgi:hypothetical protein
MGFNYTLVGPNLSRGRLFRIIGSKKDDAFPLIRLDVKMPAIAFFRKSNNGMGEVEVATRIALNTGVILVTDGDIGYTHFGLSILGFGFSVTIQLSF